LGAARGVYGAADAGARWVGYSQTGGRFAATLSTTGATWASVATRGNVLSLDGTSGMAATGTPVLNTAASYSLSAWVKLANTTASSTLAGTPTNAAAWRATGPLNLGSAGASAYFPGELSDVQAWNYELSPSQVTALQEQIK
jgi:hypothetical protein